MLKIITCFLIATITIFPSCSPGKKKPPETALDAGRDFIRATLDGDFTSAEALLLKDESNMALFSSYEDFYKRLPEDKKSAYKKADYNINTFRDVNDSVSLINYSNTYMHQPMNIRLVKKQSGWLVDFKYTSDTTAL